MTADEREKLIRRAVDAMLAANVRVDEVHEAEAAMRAGSDAYTRARAQGAIEAFTKLAEYDRRQRDAARVAEIVQVTDADRQHAIADLEMLASGSRFASPHATRTDADEFTLALEMRAREIARRRVARENADARTLTTPRADRVEEPDPFDPLTNGAGQWASPPLGGRKGR